MNQSTAETPTRPRDADRLREFGDAIDAIRKRVEAQVGSEDVAYMRRLDRFSKRMEILGRLAIHFSIDPFTYLFGVGALWVHKQIQGEEIGHAMMHGIFDHLPDAYEYHSDTYVWDNPAYEPAWQEWHVRQHHVYTNIVGRDDNIHFGLIRFNEGTPWHWYHRLQMLTLVPFSASLSMLSSFHATGINDLMFGNGRPEKFDVIEQRDLATVLDASKKFLRKCAPYYAKELVLYPLLAGPFFPKVLLGNLLAEVMRDVWVAATVLSGHIANDVAVYPEGTRAGTRGEYYAMQVGATNNYEAGRWVSILSGGLDCHIEHHLFPSLPPNRLREIRQEVEETCAAHGVRYRREPWGSLLKKSLVRIAEMARRPSSPMHRQTVPATLAQS